MTDKDEWPTFGEELARKGLETLEKWTERVTRGEATERDLYVVTEVLYSSMVGLVPLDALEPILEINRALEIDQAF